LSIKDPYDQTELQFISFILNNYKAPMKKEGIGGWIWSSFRPRKKRKRE